MSHPQNWAESEYKITMLYVRRKPLIVFAIILYRKFRQKMMY